MALLFISDLHLNQAASHLTELFQLFLAEHAPKAQTLFILGDFFDYWIGDDAASSYHLEIAQELRQFALKNKTKIYFLSGNRDFLLAQAYANLACIEIIKEPFLLNHQGQRILLFHGDRQCADEKAHQYFRQVTDMPFIQKAFLSLPVKWRIKTAELIRKKSQQRFQQQKYAEDISKSCLDELIQQFNPDVIIHGHIHNPMIEISFHSKQIERYVLSDWGVSGNFLILNENNQKNLVYFK